MLVAPDQTAVQGQQLVQGHYQPPRACRRAADVQGTCASCSTPAPFFGLQHLLTGLLLFRAPVEMFHPNPSMEEESTLSPDARAGKPRLKLQLQRKAFVAHCHCQCCLSQLLQLACTKGEGDGRQPDCCAVLSCWGRQCSI